MNKHDLRYTLDRLYECRNLEISNLWQRSVFLSVFLILCFTAYGYLIPELGSILGDNDIDAILYLNSIALFLAVIGALFSVVWILMTKSSKGWYEVYETAIHNFENTYFLKLKLPNAYIMGNMLLKNENKSKNIFSTKAGPYSPSRLNIIIGQISLLIWGLFILIHFFVLIKSADCICNVYVITSFILFMILIFGIWLVFKKVKSDFLAIPSIDGVRKNL